MNCARNDLMNPQVINTFLQEGKNRIEKVFESGEEILKEGEKKDQLFILAEGSVEVLKEGVQIATVNEKGAVFGEISALLKTPHNATVRAITRSVFYIIPEAEKFISENPSVTLAVARMLAERLAAIDARFAELKKRLTIV